MSFVDVKSDVYIGHSVSITPLGGETPERTLLTLGERSAIGSNTTFICSIDTENARIPGDYSRRAPIHVNNDVWIGADVTILDGVTIGEQAIVGAGAVVTEDVPPRTVVAGVPAKKIKDIEEEY